MKRLVICCDGTWNAPDSMNVTNIEKIARAIESDAGESEGVQQLVLYLSGVGSGSYEADRLLGGAFGLGLFSNIRSAYRFLALNYEVGDELFVFGFSRGAYTARSVVGMIARVGLLTRESLVHDKLREAIDRYQHKPGPDGAYGESDAAFKQEFCHPETPVRFLGVFDTVGALGVPGAVRKSHQFHDVTLHPSVQCARQALAIDEQRMTFEPCLWELAADCTEDDERIRQVWFEGVHSDVGGGYRDCGLSDKTLTWMVSESRAKGLVFDQELLGAYLPSQASVVRHQSLSTMYKAINLVTLTEMRGGRKLPHFEGSRRRLDSSGCVGVRIAESAASHFQSDPGYRPPNLQAFADATSQFAGLVEPGV